MDIKWEKIYSSYNEVKIEKIYQNGSRTLQPILVINIKTVEEKR